MLALSGCNITRYVPRGENLLKNEVSFKGVKSISAEDVIRMEPNRRVLVPKVYLMAYNAGVALERDSSRFKQWWLRNPGRLRRYEWLSNWLQHSFGEAPATVTPEDVSRDSAYIAQAYAAAGYFYPEIVPRIDTINTWWERKKVNVSYEVTENLPYKVRAIHLDISYWEHEVNYRNLRRDRLLKPGEIFSYDMLARERTRIANLLRDSGFFTFSPNMISFEVDTFVRTRPLKTAAYDSVPTDNSAHWLDVTLRIRSDARKYNIREIVFQVLPPANAGSDDPGEPVRLRASELSPAQRLEYGIGQRQLDSSANITFLTYENYLRRFNYNFVMGRVYVRENDWFRQHFARQTQNRLQEMSLFQYVTINYLPIDSIQSLDVIIEARLAPQYEFKAGIKSYTNDITSGASILPVLGSTLNLRKKNAIWRAEVLEANAAGDVGLYPINEKQQGVFWRLQGGANLSFPRFVLPLQSAIPYKYRKDLLRYRAVTTFNTGIQTERRQQFDRTAFSLGVNYRWFNRLYSQQEATQIAPMTVEIISVQLKDSAFQKVIDNQPDAIRRSFVPRFNSRMSFSYTYSDYASTRTKVTRFNRYSYEGGGNIPYLMDVLSRHDTTLDGHTLVLSNNTALSYGRYLKVSYEGKLYIPVTRASELILRGAIGAATAFGNTDVLLPESRFFAGGPSSMRGWQSNTLGPGTFALRNLQQASEINVSSLLAIGGEYLVELNAEYRFDVYSFLEMAVFSDLGNVWFNNRQRVRDALGDTENRMTLSWQNLYPGWDAGLGFRFDFSFLILRLDVAQQLFAPDLVANPDIRGWVLRRGLGGTRAQYQLGIGYPF